MGFLDYIPWHDETYLVELGRQFLCGGDATTTLLNPDGTPMMPLFYLGPCLQELAYRAFGVWGVRLSPFVGLVVMGLLFRLFVKRTTTLRRLELNLLMVLAMTVPLCFQSAALARLDTWSLAFVFAALVCLVGSEKGIGHLIGAAVCAAVSVFMWPTAGILLPLYLVAGFRSRAEARGMILFCLFGLAAVAILCVPLVWNWSVVRHAFAGHCDDSFHRLDLLSIVMPFVGEVVRAPFLLGLAAVGFVSWVMRRAWGMIAAFVFSLGASIVMTPHLFRIVFLTPFVLLMCVEAMERCKARKICRGALWCAVVYGVLAGPILTPFVKHPTLEAGLKDELEAAVGRGPRRVFAADRAAYYIGRELGWAQFGYAAPGHNGKSEFARPLLEKADVVITQDFDKYVPTQQCASLFVLFCKYVLEAARAEENVPMEEKSRAARFGSTHTTIWRDEIQLPGFVEAAHVGVVHAFVRERKK